MKFIVSPLMFVLALVAVFFGEFYGFIIYIITIVLHEFSHSEVAKRRGYILNELRLEPYGASLSGAFEAVKWDDEIAIAVAGPICNAIFALICISFWWIFPESYYFTDVFVGANVVTFLINLLPVYPLDGGRILRAFLSRKFSPKRTLFITRIVAIFVCLLAMLAVAFSIYYMFNFSLVIFVVFILSSTFLPDKTSKYQRLFSVAYIGERLRNGIPIREIMISESTKLSKVFSLLNVNFFTRFIIIDSSFHKIATIDEFDLEKASYSYGNNTTILQGIDKNS